MDGMEIDDCFEIDRLVRYRGYPFETHTVHTEDGYILKMYRIRHGKDGPNSCPTTAKPPVLLAHGLFGTCCEFLIEEKGIAYHLADHGFDVWLANNRGTPFSKNHVEWDCREDGRKYWDFSYHEMGYYDLPAFIDCIVENTGVPKIFFIGHSQGTTSFFVMLSKRPEYNNKIQLAILLAPTAACNFSVRFLFMEYFLIPSLEVLSYIFGYFEFTSPDNIRKLMKKCCHPNHFIGRMGCNVVQAFFSFMLTPPKALSLTYTLLSLNPIPVSTKQLIHYRQAKSGGVIKHFDYGPVKNKELYGSAEPPPYDFSLISAPLVMFIGKKDAFGHPKDVHTIAGLIGSNAKEYIVERDDFRHLDFLLAHDVVEMVFKPLVNVLNEYCDSKQISVEK